MEVKMIRKSLFTLVLLIGIILSSSCGPNQISPTPAPNTANPASVFCEQNSGTLDLRQDASGGVAGMCVFPDGSECDEWAYFRGECKPADPVPAQAQGHNPTVIPSPVPVNPDGYQGWWTYTNATYGFSLLLPFDWVVGETTVGDPLMNGHTIMLQPGQPAAVDLQIRMTFRRSGEDVPLWPTGVGSGEFVSQGTLDVGGQNARRVLFVCSTGQVNNIWYHGEAETSSNIQIGDMEFGFILGYHGAYCQDGYSLGGKNEYVGEMVIASLKVP
jgi:putative hemolysin